MDQKVTALYNSLFQLDELEKSVSGDTIDSPQSLAIKINKFVDTLRCVFDEGSTMDESTIFPIPAELLVHIDTEGNNNPDLYQHKLIEDCELRAETLSKKMIYLQDLETNIKTAGTESN